jgi:hypothetical protein
MGKVGRNAFCPCGSGKKYKACCIQKKQQSDKITWPTFPEDYVISELLKSSSEFIAFYGAEREKITKPVYWVRDLSLPVGIDYRCTKLPHGTQVIRLRRIPAIVVDALKIAHELQHLVLDYEGFVTTGATAQYENLSSSLNSMVHDPLVNSRLQVYGFDLLQDYETELDENIRQLSNNSKSPVNPLDRVHWIFNYLGNILEWEVIRGETTNNKNKFLHWFDERYPDIAQEANDLIILVRDIGFDSPKKQITLFKTIIEKYNLKNKVSMEIV